MKTHAARGGVAIESLENRRLLYASIPAGYTQIAKVYIRPKATTYDSGLTLLANTSYFLRVAGSAFTSNQTYHGDAAFAAGSPVTTPAASSATWGVTVSAAGTSEAVSAWGAYQSDHVYGQTIRTSHTGSLVFTFANDSADAVSTLAVSVYAPLPIVSVAQIRTDRSVGSIKINTLSADGAAIPVNDADFDHNGVADNQQSGRVAGDGFLLPITLPAVTGAATHDHYLITVPKGLRVWLNADRTGSTVGVGLRESVARTVYLEATGELPASTDVKISEVYSGTTVTQNLPVSTFQFTGRGTVSTGQIATYGSDATAGEWSSAIGGTMTATSTAKTAQYANVLWGETPIDGYVDYRVDGNFIWGFPVAVD